MEKRPMIAVQQSRNTFIRDREDTSFLQFQAINMILGVWICKQIHVRIGRSKLTSYHQSQSIG